MMVCPRNRLQIVPTSRVRDPEVNGGFPTQELKRYRDLAGVGSRKGERHRLAQMGAGRCLKGQAELDAVREPLSALSGDPVPA